ncbi:ArsR/SmtB family transcription factor [Neobacillus niacini]|uniref:ArsR/SmtB family transcription factor n=1 Tax=Neobacillus niacini TaxID=86668 RepID=UPI0027D78246|nr:metalloregulator ArsR/SmtB family transcription factor [Neobacillus niacini]
MNDEMAVKVYKAIGEPTRLQLVKKLASEPQMACMEITDQLDIHSNSTLTYHLKILIDCGLLVVRKEGTYRYYSLQRDVLEKYAPTLIPD